jgi:CheY-like chemotaxis protein
MSLEHDLDSIELYLESSGYSMSLDMKSVITSAEVDGIAEKIARYNKYDMIVCDYDMGNSPDGSNIARKLRAEVYTDMVFYSGNAPDNLRKILYDNRVDGVFVVDRAKLADEFEMILEDHIKKACDVNGIRGIVMDETSRFDRILREKCAKVLTGVGPEQLEAVRSDVVRRITKSAESRLKKAEKITCPITALSDFQTSDFNLVRHRLADLMKEVEHVANLLSDDGELKRMQDLRNRLAHLECIYSDDGWMCLSDDNADRFDFERFREIRKNLREIGQAIDKI